ncbi:MAG: LysM peptidoglycan-binding domain-containing protein [Desulfobacteraceae bacterium]|nr:LysM peptidoglycan-binding domain-containing protein [Desulfobacteraceae bacterium]
MSISKTSLLLISALSPLLLFTACASQYAASGPAPDQAVLAAAEHPAAPQEQLTNEEAPSTEELTVPEPEEMSGEEMKELEALGSWDQGGEPAPLEGDYDFPVVLNKQVAFYIDFFQNKHHKIVARWLARSTRYLPMIQEELRKAGLPLDLAYLPMIESGYCLTACSPANAVGPWQFTGGTARTYKLRVDSYVDERLDPVKSTRAAVRYLARLHDDLGSWKLAVAGYNAGEGNIRAAMQQGATKDFWKLSSYLHLETKRYVPKLMAAIIIAKNPEKYGFANINYEKPLDFEIAEVPRWTPLQAVSVACNVSVETLHELNRELRQEVTPPSLARYPLRVPRGKAEVVACNLPRVRTVIATRYKTHVVAKKETIAKICRKYCLTKVALLRANNLRRPRLFAGLRLRIPFHEKSYQLLAAGRVSGYKPSPVGGRDRLLHTVRPGETLSSIANEHNLSVDLIVSWNHLSHRNHLHPGQKIALYVAGGEKTAGSKESPLLKPKTFKLASARPFAGRAILTARKKKLARKKAIPASHLTYYKVRLGDTLWTIARKFNVSTAEIKRWNQLVDDHLQPGSRLLLRVEEDA